MMSAKSFGVLLCVLALGFRLPLITAAATTWDVVVSGLDNPRGVAFGPDGALYIAQAGSGGDGPCGPGPEGTRCYGESGVISRYDVRSGGVTDVVTGLPSLATEDGQMFAIGPNDLSLHGRGNLIFTIGFGGYLTTREAVFGPNGAKLASWDARRRMAHGTWWRSSVSSRPTRSTGDEVDSYPYGLLALAGRQVVADAGANALLEVRANGTIAPLATFPDRMVDAPPFLGLPPGAQIPMDAVPTAVALGLDGNFYVGQLTGFPFPSAPRTSTACRRRRARPRSSPVGSHTSSISTFGPDGSLYVLEIAKNGLLAAFTTND